MHVPFEHSSMYLKKSTEYLIVILIYGALFIVPLIFSVVYVSILPLVALVFEIAGLHFLYVDEKYKLERNSNKYGMYYSSLMHIHKAPRYCKLNWSIYKQQKKAEREGIRFKKDSLALDSKVKQVFHNYNEEDDEKKRTSQRLDSFESDLTLLSDFSFLRKTGYFILGFGFVLQFISILTK